MSIYLFFLSLFFRFYIFFFIVIFFPFFFPIYLFFYFFFVLLGLDVIVYSIVYIADLPNIVLRFYYLFLILFCFRRIVQYKESSSCTSTDSSFLFHSKRVNKHLCKFWSTNHSSCYFLSLLLKKIVLYLDIFFITTVSFIIQIISTVLSFII